MLFTVASDRRPRNSVYWLLVSNVPYPWGQLSIYTVTAFRYSPGHWRHKPPIAGERAMRSALFAMRHVEAGSVASAGYYHHR